MKKILSLLVLSAFVPSIVVGVSLRDKAPLSRLKRLGYSSSLFFKNDDFTKGLIEGIEKEKGEAVKLKILKLEKTKNQLNLTYKISASEEDVYVPAVDSVLKKCQEEIDDFRRDYENSLSKDDGRDVDKWDLRVNTLQMLYQHSGKLYVDQNLSLACVTGSALSNPAREYHLLKVGEFEIHTTDLLAGDEYEFVSLDADGIENMFFVVNYVDAIEISELKKKLNEDGFYEVNSKEYWHIEFLRENNEDILIYNSGSGTEKNAIIEIPLDQAIEVPTPRKPGYWDRIKAMQKRVWARRR